MAGGKIRKEKKTSSSHFQGGIPFFKSRGQHILKNPMVVEAIVNKAGIKSTDVILEIGPGTGNLTKKLLEAGKSVIAVELDDRMVLELQRRFQGTPFSNRLKIIQGDVLKCDLPYFDICVANIPYQISSPLVTKLLNHKDIHKAGFRCAIIMFQKEFATRLVAQPGDHDYCRLSVNTQLKARVNHLLKVGKNNFRPPPKVDSSVVRIEPRSPLPIPHEKLQEWDALLRICFSRRNKTLGSIFRQKNQLALLEKNYKTLQSLGMEIEGNDDGGHDDGDDDEMDVEDDDADEEGNDSDFKSKVLGVLKKYDYEEKRSAKLTQNEFIHLLSVFNEAGIHFR
ncbi:LOW QUALITY PROTEIN: uncharacterized protein [Phyllobates terribilis]|uniref:LOW QUALITY PROTEIN: uncharacterized protein n=1 Tax=Phyllobates terribilis TaxID=111132 RepID=UPI003CCB3B0C